ncbi:MAG: HD-GYP domain-containing protein [Deltaproteobacteria bacterium]|nr:HD-GYP domain-containing protein [Deltaproteobacteria bacterium]
MVYMTGGLKFVYSHAMYLPIVLAGFRFGMLGGVLTGIMGGLALGPYMPLLVSPYEPQETHAWLYRMAFFALIGLVVGGISLIKSLQVDFLGNVLQEVSATFARTLRGFAKAIEAKDHYTIGHSERVACNAAILGMRLDMDDQDLQQLYWSGLLHDLGKLGVPEHILHKPGKLDPEELENVRQHSGIGDEILSRISPLFYSISDGVRHHHEKWDGTGYPDGLQEDQIPFYARVLAVCDVFDALTSERTYRGPLAPKEAANIIRKGAGTHMDPEVVEQFLMAYEARELVWTETKRPCNEPSEFDYGFIWDYYTNRYRDGGGAGWMRG